MLAESDEEYLGNDFDEVTQGLVARVLGVIPIKGFEEVFDAD